MRTGSPDATNFSNFSKSPVNPPPLAVRIDKVLPSRA
jgi:hypothetical protein